MLLTICTCGGQNCTHFFCGKTEYIVVSSALGCTSSAFKTQSMIQGQKNKDDITLVEKWEAVTTAAGVKAEIYVCGN